MILFLQSSRYLHEILHGLITNAVYNLKEAAQLQQWFWANLGKKPCAPPPLWPTRANASSDQTDATSSSQPVSDCMVIDLTVEEEEVCGS